MIEINPPVIFSTYKDNPIYHDLLQEFVDCLDDRVAKCHLSFSEENWLELSRAMHQLRGAAATYGFPALAEIAGQLEIATAKDVSEADASNIEATLHLLKATCKSIEAGMTILRVEV